MNKKHLFQIFVFLEEVIEKKFLRFYRLIGRQLYCACQCYKQGCHNVLISKICPYFEGMCLRKYFCPYF